MESIDNDEFLALFGKLGLAFPSSEEELEAFDRIYADYAFQTNASDIDANAIWKKANEQSKTVTGSDYFKRTVLAAEILFQLHKEPTMGRLKLQKLIFLCQHTSQMELHTNFLKQAMGPYDPRMMRSLESQMKKNKWFIYRPKDILKYHPLENFGNHKSWFSRYFGEEQGNINYLIDLFKTALTRKVELVGTIFDVWQIAESENQVISSAYLVSKVYGYSPEKQKFSENEIVRELKWMIDIGLHPKRSRIVGI